MRSAYGTQLAVLTDQLAQMCESAGAALEKATRSLLGADLALADRVIADHRKVAVAGSRVQATGYALLTRQAPVARDLRAIVSSIQIVADIERMHALALHVAQLVRRRHPRHVLPEEVRGDFAEMGRIALELVDSALQVIVSCDLGRARYIRDADDAMDDLHRHLFGVLLDRPWNHGTVAAIDVTLLSRYYERFADHAVEISRQVIFQATGQIRPRERMPVY